jgi:prepilin-type N-terminal cleavage/methylation domain-containing protein
VAKRNLVLIALSALRVASCESNQCGIWASFAMCVVDVRLRREYRSGRIDQASGSHRMNARRAVVFTLIEILIALVVLGLLLIALYAMRQNALSRPTYFENDNARLITSNTERAPAVPK